MANETFDAKIVSEAGLEIPSGAGEGKELTSDASGNATWKTPTILEHGRAEQTAEKTKISAPSVTATSVILATMELAEGFVSSSVTNREPGVGFTVWSSFVSGRHINWAVLG